MKEVICMAQASLSIKLTPEDKAELNKMCNNWGVPASTLLNMFIKTVIRERRIPFEIKEKHITGVTEEEYLDSISGFVDEIVSRSRGSWIPYSEAMWEDGYVPDRDIEESL